MSKQQTVVRKPKTMTTFEKAQVIAASRRIHKSSCSDVWMVESDSVKRKFYCVQYVDVEGQGEFICDCPAYTYGMTNPCKHIISIAVKEAA